jgi:hypothetical protein
MRCRGRTEASVVWAQGVMAVWLAVEERRAAAEAEEVEAFVFSACLRRRLLLVLSQGRR